MNLPAALSGLSPLAGVEIRPAGVADVAELFVVQAAIVPTDAGHFLEGTRQLEDRLEPGGKTWVAGRGKTLIGYGFIDALPGLPGVYDLAGGIVPTWRRRGIGSRLLDHILAAARDAGAIRLSCRADDLTDETAGFLLGRGFYIEHEECLLELADLGQLPEVGPGPSGRIVTLPRDRAVAEFCRLYDRSFAGRRWSQPYTPGEVESLLVRAEDLLFLARDEAVIGVAWLELIDEGKARIEPIGVARAFQGQGHGRRLLVAALGELRRRGVRTVEIGLWRENAAAMRLYQSLGFSEVANWYYLATDLPGPV